MSSSLFLVFGYNDDYYCWIQKLEFNSQARWAANSRLPLLFLSLLYAALVVYCFNRIQPMATITVRKQVAHVLVFFSHSLRLPKTCAPSCKFRLCCVRAFLLAYIYVVLWCDAQFGGLGSLFTQRELTAIAWIHLLTMDFCVARYDASLR